jgi:Fe-S cluster biogenesis protein NfuA
VQRRGRLDEARRVTLNTIRVTVETVRDQAAAAIEQYIRPLVEADGGRIELLEATEARIVIRLFGVCSGCPGQPFTVARVIEPALRRALGVNIEVEARFGDSTP